MLSPYRVHGAVTLITVSGQFNEPAANGLAFRLRLESEKNVGMIFFKCRREKPRNQHEALMCSEELTDVCSPLLTESRQKYP